MKLLLVCLFTGIAGVILSPILTYSLMWREIRRNGNIGSLPPQAKGGMLGWLARGVMSGWASTALVILFSPLRLWRGLWRSQADPSCAKPPVIFVHGVYHNASAWLLYRRWFKKNGFKNFYAFEYSSWNTSFFEVLQSLEYFVEEVCSFFPNRQVILVGHSLGGLLCRGYLGKAENPRRIGAVVTLGSPHKGSKLAALGMGGLARSLAYRGPLIQQLERQATNSDVPCIAVYSPLDSMVSPSSALRCADPGWEHIESRPVSHVGMLFDRSTAMLVLEYLNRICLCRC